MWLDRREYCPKVKVSTVSNAFVSSFVQRKNNKRKKSYAPSSEEDGDQPGLSLDFTSILRQHSKYVLFGGVSCYLSGPGGTYH